MSQFPDLVPQSSPIIMLDDTQRVCAPQSGVKLLRCQKIRVEAFRVKSIFCSIPTHVSSALTIGALLELSPLFLQDLTNTSVYVAVLLARADLFSWLAQGK